MDTTQRAAYQAWYQENRSQPKDWQELWDAAWQASRKQMAEEAIKEFTGRLIPFADDRGGEDYAYNSAHEDCIAFLRRLSTPEGGL